MIVDGSWIPNGALGSVAKLRRELRSRKRDANVYWRDIEWASAQREQTIAFKHTHRDWDRQGRIQRYYADRKRRSLNGLARHGHAIAVIRRLITEVSP